MKLTRATNYAVRALSEIASRAEQSRGEEKPEDVASLAEELEVPVAFLGKILGKLASNGVLKATRGAGGGYTLGDNFEKLSMRNVIDAVEGPLKLSPCGEDDNHCGKQLGCNASVLWQRLENRINEALESESLLSLVGNIKERRL